MINNIIRLSEKKNGGLYHFYRYNISDHKTLELWVNKGSHRVDRIIGYDKIDFNDVVRFNEVTGSVPVYIESLYGKGYEVAEALDLNRLLTFAKALDIAGKDNENNEAEEC